MKTDTFVGIDLGTSSSCLAYTYGDSIPEILKFTDGNASIPSVVTFTDNGIYIGNDAAKNNIEMTSWNTVKFYKRRIGQNIERTYNGVSYSPVETSAMMITKLLRELKKQIDVDVKKAVITIPSDFGDVERHSIHNAATIAGLDEIRLLSESLSVAMAYGKSNNIKSGNIIVFDFGAGALNIAIVNIKENNYKIITEECNNELGGINWDIEISTALQKNILASCGLGIKDVISNNEFRWELMKEAEKAKNAISEKETYEGCITLNGLPTNFVITREEIMNEIYALLMRAINMVSYVIRRSSLRMDDIDAIVMSGCSSTMLQVKDTMCMAFPTAKVVLFEPEYAVAKGAALYAESIFGNKKTIKTVPVTTKTYGILAGIDGEEKICNIVFKNVPVPNKGTINCRPKKDNQEFFDIIIYESNAKKGTDYIDPRLGKMVKKFKIPLTGKIFRGKTKIPIHVHTDANGKMTMIMECNGVKNEMTLVDDKEMEVNKLLASVEKLKKVI